MSDSITATQTAQPVSAPTPLFKCHLLGSLPETLRTHQLCMAEWLRAYTLQENNGPEWFEGKPMLLYGYLEIDQLLTELIEHSFYTDPKDSSIKLTNKFVEGATADDLENKREFIRDSFLNFLPKQDDAGTNLSIYEHGYAYTTLFEFINKCIYYLQDLDAEPDYLKGLTPEQKRILRDAMTARGDKEEVENLAAIMRRTNDIKARLNTLP